jgi:hypothetical protein
MASSSVAATVPLGSWFSPALKWMRSCVDGAIRNRSRHRLAMEQWSDNGVPGVLLAFGTVDAKKYSRPEGPRELGPGYSLRLRFSCVPV